MPETLLSHPNRIKDHWEQKNRQAPEVLVYWWALTDSNRRPSACKADALNQLS